MYGQFENTFMVYLPRLCEHCLNPSCVATCPSGAIYKREEDGIVLIDQDKCRGWRLCISGCPYKKSTSTGKAASQKNVSSVTHELSQANPPCAQKPAWVASGIWACCFTTLTASRKRRAPSVKLTSMNASAKYSSIHTILSDRGSPETRYSTKRD